MESGDKLNLINDFFIKEYPFAVLKSKNENDFENELKEILPKELTKLGYLEFSIVIKLSELKSKYLKDRDNEKNAKDFEAQIKINDIICDNLANTYNCNYDKFNNYFDNIKELIPLIKEYPEYYKSCINTTYYLKKKFQTFFNDNSNKKELYLIELNQYENYFNERLDSELKELLLKKEYKDLYDKQLIKKKVSFKKLIEVKNKFIIFFDENYQNISENSTNEEQFKNNFEIKKNKEAYSLKKKYEDLYNYLFLKYLNIFNIDSQNELKYFSLKEKKIIEEYLTEISIKDYEDKNWLLKIKEIIMESKNIFKKEFKERMKENIYLYIEKLTNDEKRKIKHINILLYGSSGQGKSTLINKIFNLKDEEKLKTSYGGNLTKETKIISSAKLPLRLIETKGIDITDKNNHNLQEIDEITKIKEENTDVCVNCIWYCLSPLNTGSFDAEIKSLKRLGKRCEKDKLPIIVVGTKAVDPSFNEELILFLESNEISYPFCPVLAEYMCKTEPYGIKELIMISIEKAMKEEESPCYKGIIKNIIQELNLKIDESNRIIDDDIDKKKEILLRKMKDNYNVSDLKKDMKKFFEFLLNQCNSINLSSENNKIINERKTYINSNEIKRMVEECLKNYEDNFKKFIDVHTEKLFKKLLQNQSNDYNIIDSKTEKQIKYKLNIILKNNLQKKYERYYLKNILDIYIDILIEIFHKIYISQKEKIKQNKDYIISKISNQFKELKKSVELYNIDENSSIDQIPDRLKLKIINNMAKKNEYIHIENMLKLNNEKENNEMEAKHQLLIEENDNKIKMKQLENEKGEKELDYKFKIKELECKNEENKRISKLKEKDLELEEKRQNNQHDIERLSIEKDFQLKELQIKNKHEIDKMKLMNEKEIEIQKLKLRNEQIKLEKIIVDKINVNHFYNQNQYLGPINPFQQNYYNGNIPMNPQFMYNYNYQEKIETPGNPPQMEQNNNENEINNSNDSNQMNNECLNDEPNN